VPSMPDPGSRLQEILFHELHHRFYNSLQLLSSMTGRLGRGQHGAADIFLLQDRISLLGALHRSLSQPFTSDTDMPALLHDLCTGLIKGFGRADVELRIERAMLPSDPIVARGLTLIVVELVTNALKHARVPGSPWISVAVERDATGYRMIVANSAVTRNVQDFCRPRIAARITEALGGTLRVTSLNGYEVAVTVPAAAPGATATVGSCPTCSASR